MRLPRPLAVSDLPLPLSICRFAPLIRNVGCPLTVERVTPVSLASNDAIRALAPSSSAWAASHFFVLPAGQVPLLNGVVIAAPAPVGTHIATGESATAGPAPAPAMLAIAVARPNRARTFTTMGDLRGEPRMPRPRGS